MKRKKEGKKTGRKKIGNIEIERKAGMKKKQEKQVRLFIIGMFVLLIFIFVAYSFIQASLKFTYAGLEFEKVRQGELILYRSDSFPIYLRNDPRDLRTINIESRILLQPKVGIGGSKEIIEGCSDSTIAATTLSIFYGKNGLEPFPGTTDKNESKINNIAYIECNINSNYSAILLEKGDETKIEKEGECYILRVKGCEDVMKVSERFIVASYAHSNSIEV